MPRTTTYQISLHDIINMQQHAWHVLNVDSSDDLLHDVISCNVAIDEQLFRVFIITGSTVVLTCCKGDSSSQWETPIFGPPQTENPLTDLDKICHQ